MFKLAYPWKSVQNSKILLDRYRRSISKYARGFIKSQVMHYKVSGKAVLWSNIKKCARLYDADEEKGETASDSSEDIIIAVGREPSKKLPYRLNDDQAREPNFRPRIVNNTAYENWRQSDAPREVRQHGRQKVNKEYQRSVGNSNKICSYCDRVGHVSESCRKRLNSCFACGSIGHYYRQCPKNIRAYEYRNEQEDGAGDLEVQDVSNLPRRGGFNNRKNVDDQRQLN